MAFEQSLDRIAPSVSESVSLERERQESTLGMVASDNHGSEAVLEAEDAIPSLSRGGHLSRGHDVTVSGQRYDVDSAAFPGAQAGPLMHTVAGKAVGFAAARTRSKRTPNGSSPTRSASARWSTNGDSR